MKKLITLIFGILLSLNVSGACENSAWNIGLWATYNTGDIVVVGGKDYIAIGGMAADGAYATSPPSAGWALLNNPCAPPGTAPTLSTTLPSSVLAETATTGGNATVQGTSVVIDKGIAWSLAATPTISDNKVSFGSGGLGVFSMSITLPQYTRIYIRAYATNSEKTGYGAQKTLYTGKTPHTFTTHAAIDIHCESFTTGLESGQLGNISNVTQPVATAGGAYAAVTNWGWLYGTVLADVDASTPSSLVGDTKVEVHISNAFGGLNLGNRYAEITGLTPGGITYHYKAYGTNPMGTGYGTTPTQNFMTTTCTEYYSCPWTTTANNRWSLNADCSTNNGTALAAASNDAILYHRHDWLTAEIANLDADVTTNATTSGRAMIIKPYRLVVQSGGRVVQNNPVFIGGFQLIINNNGQYGHNGTMLLQNEGTAGADGHIARVVNDGSMLVDGSYNNYIKMTGLGEFCVFGTFVNSIGPGSLNEDYGTPEPSLPDTRYVNGRCVGTSTLPVELLYFTAQRHDSKFVTYRWATGSEINNDYFRVEISTDGMTWKTRTSVSGEGNSTIIVKYSEDKETGTEYKYTRLVQVDYDGKTTYSMIRDISIGSEGVSVIPITNGFIIDSEDSVNVNVLNISGANILNITTSGYNVIELLEPSGIYIVRVGNVAHKIFIRH